MRSLNLFSRAYDVADEELFPRDLKTWERDLLLWMLPEDRPGYREYRDSLQRLTIIAQGRRGAGNYILGPAGVQADNESPLPQVFAYGVVETKRGSLSVTIRERLGDQIEFEMAVLGRGDPFEPTEVTRRWTFSDWLPGAHCPACGASVREVEMKTVERRLVLVVCRTDERLWIYDGGTEVNHPIPVTNFYNELMFQKNIRDPKIAFSSRRLFQNLDEWSDIDLASAFSSYNVIRTKVPVEGQLTVARQERRSWMRRIKDVFTRK